jgi:hypothetical protein
MYIGGHWFYSASVHLLIQPVVKYHYYLEGDGHYYRRFQPAYLIIAFKMLAYYLPRHLAGFYSDPRVSLN